MYKYFAPVLNSILNKPIGEPKELLSILLSIIVQVNIKVGKIPFPFGIFLGRDIEHMRDPQIQQMLRLQPGNKVPNIQLQQYLNRLKAFQQAITFTPAKCRMCEPIAV